MSNFWVICGLALLCLGSVKCSRYFPEEDEYFLDKTENSEEVQTEKEEDTEWDLDNTRKLLNEINDVRLLASDDGSDKEVTREVCVLENCEETGGNCSKNETGGFQCLCPGSIEYNNETGCNVTDDKCQEEKPSCKKTGGACSIDKDQNIQCDCPASIEYSQDTGCNVTDKKCETVKPNCKKTGGSCSIGKDKNIQCVCPVNTAYSEEKDTGCIDDKCVEECGIRHDEQNEKLKCLGGPFGYVRCICIVQDDKNIDFDYYDKQCKTDYCKVNCGSLQCGYEDKFDENKYECICPNPAYEEFVRTNNTCKINYCKKVCGSDERVECDDKYNKDLKVEDCKCNDDGYVYTGKKCTKKCDDDCENEGTCEDKGDYKLCQCKDGTNGDMCENIEDCSGKYKNCIGKRGKCIFENGAAKCSCPKGKVEYAYSCKDDDCIERCGIHHDEQKGKLICVGSPFWVTCKCVDKDDKSIDFDPRDKVCKTNYCHKKCGVLECEGDKFDKDRAKCICPNPFEEFDEEENECKVNYCKKVCGADKRVECDDKYNKDITVEDCKCNDDKYVYFGKKCTKTCDDDCKNEGTCEKKGDFKLCKCEPGTSGDMCENIEDCISGKYKDCKDGKGECKFENKTATCSCPHGKEVIASLNYCEVPCKEDKDCKGPNRMCKAKMFCQCQEGYGGEDCTEVLGCKTLAEKCKQAQAKCVFDKDEREKATCKCNDNFVYNRTKNECKHVFCHLFNPCKEPANCTYDESTGIGYCKCPADKYFNYKAQTCEDLPDKCLMKKIPCGELYDCKKGKCVCKEKVKEGEECKPILCEKGSCFENANCSKEDGSCYCEKTKYFKDKGCKDATCSFEDFKKNCTCPRDTTRTDKEECKASEEKKCTKDCGYGVCVKDKEKEICNCFNFADKNSNGTCILKTMYCEGGKLQEDSMKCKCEGQYTQADDGITCRPKTCKDEDAKKECANKGAECVTNKSKDGYECKCPTGYVPDVNKKCTESCSIEENIRKCTKNEQLCFNLLSKEGYTCYCPPTLTEDDTGKCSAKAENGYMISNIFVLKKKYEINGKINTAILNDHFKESLKETFSDFTSGYLYDFRISGDALNCSAWVNFNKAPNKTDLDKIKLMTKTLSGDCEDCYENAILWPPHLLLSSEGLKNAESSKLQFCSDEVKDFLCGKETKCESNKCSCKDGFIIIQSSVKEIGGNKVLRCEDIDECDKGIHACSANTECVNTFGSYKCVCKEGYKKKETPTNPETDKSPCYDMCSPSPCGKGKCVLKGKTFDCECEAGYGGSLCDRADGNYASVKKGTVVVGAVLGTLLILGTIAVLYYIIKVKKCSGSEDYMPAARMDRAEMTERRPVRGVTNRAYE